jgi:probable O-glycosylation ligase (exosortase A-associated)
LIQGNNELAVALVMLLPMLYWMRQTAAKRWLKSAMTLAMITCSFSILGSQSRGALLAMLAMSLFLGVKSKYPVRMSLLVLVAVAAAISFMPDTWTDRMDTIRTYQADGSAMSRIWTWTTLFNAAVDRPFVGAGFQADNAVVFGRYSPSGPEWQQFEGAVYVAHSIYFQLLGEHGFVGLGLFLLLWLVTWVTASRVARQAEADASLAAWMPLLMRMVQVSLVGYAVGGAFLSLGYFDLPYYFVGYVVLCSMFVRRVANAPTAARPAGLSPASAAGGVTATATR